MNQVSELRRILLVTPVSPFSTASGSEQRSALMLEALKTLGRVDVLQLKHGNTTQVSVVEDKGNCCVMALVAGADLSLRRYQPKPELTKLVELALECQMSDFDLVVGRYVWPVCQLVIPHSVPVIADLDDFKYRCAKDSPVTWSSLRMRVQKALADFFVRRQLHRFNAVFFVSALDRLEALHFASAVLSNVPRTRADLTEPIRGSSNVLFVGSLWYRPNAEGIDWFLKNVWPSVIHQVPSATLTLVGAASSKIRGKWQIHPGVTAPGFVEDLGRAYANAALVVVPVLSGGGSNIKVLEALAYKRPCLITRFCHAAFKDELIADSDLLVASDAKDFANKVIQSLHDPDKREAMAACGHASVMHAFTAGSFKTTVVSMAGRFLSR